MSAMTLLNLNYEYKNLRESFVILGEEEILKKLEGLLLEYKVFRKRLDEEIEEHEIWIQKRREELQTYVAAQTS